MGLFIRLSRALERMNAKARSTPAIGGNGAAAQAGETSLPETPFPWLPSIALQDAVFSSAPGGIVILSEDGSIESLNPAAELLFGYCSSEAFQFEVARLLSLGGDPAASAVARLNALTAAKTAQELAGWHRDGTVIPIDALAVQMPVGKHKAFALFLTDLRERSRSEQMKSEFVATVSHELRTPLTSISGSLGLLVSGAGGSLPDAALRLIRIAHANSQRLVRLVNDILDIEKIESGAVRFDIQSIPVKPLIQQAIEDTRPFADVFNVTVQLSADSTDGVADADPDRLSQVITNLLSNAIKFSPPGGKVDVSIALREDEVRICVRDHGEGIPEDFRDRIFEKFTQADGADARHKGGTGLGLSIVQQIMTRMSGEVGFDNPSGGGTVFHVDLPRCKDLRNGNAHSIATYSAGIAAAELTRSDGRAA